jgi:hypothetical protein
MKEHLINTRLYHIEKSTVAAGGRAMAVEK